jgi:50S ribosomal protein L16 3-hydroxylase
MTASPIEIDAVRHAPLGMTPARFLRDYWQKRPLLIRGAFPGFVAPLAPEDLAGLACEETALSRLVRHDRAGDRWTVRQGPFAEAEFPALPREDWTLLVQDVDKWDPDVAALLPAFDFLPRWRIDDVMVSFAAPGGSVGAHVDQYDVFLLQGLGRRRWQVDARPRPDTRFRDDVELRLLRHFDPNHDWILAPGDMLYLPPGVPHHGVALDACLTFSVGMRAPAQGEMLVDFAEFLAEQLPDSARYADPDLVPVKDSGEIDEAAMRRVAAALPWLQVVEDAGPRRGRTASVAAGSAARVARKHAGTPDGFPRQVPASLLRTWFARFITRYRSAGEVIAPPRPPSPAQVEARLQAGARLHRHPHARVAWIRAGRGAEFFIDGEGHACSLAAAKCFSAQVPIDAATLSALDAPARALMHDLVRRGAFLLSRVPGRSQR